MINFFFNFFIIIEFCVIFCDIFNKFFVCNNSKFNEIIASIICKTNFINSIIKRLNQSKRIKANILKMIKQYKFFSSFYIARQFVNYVRFTHITKSTQ